MRYLERHKAALEAMPPGAYAVTEEDGKAQPGVIFCLRQRNASPAKQHHTASPVHPYYLVYIQSNGVIRYGCGGAWNILMSFEAAAAGQTQPITRLCQRFDQETQNGRRIEHYETLLRRLHCPDPPGPSPPPSHRPGPLQRRRFQIGAGIGGAAERQGL